MFYAFQILFVKFEEHWISFLLAEHLHKSPRLLVISDLYIKCKASKMCLWKDLDTILKIWEFVNDCRVIVWLCKTESSIPGTSRKEAVEN